jgi:dTDP-4-dehydrorhamnose reductase
MNFLIIGASGFIGRHIKSNALTEGHSVTGTTTQESHPELFKFNLFKDRISDCLPSSFFSQSEQVVAIMTAVVSNMDLCLTDIEKSRQINVVNTIQLLKDLYERDCKIVFLSTGYVFDGSQGNWKEGDIRKPINKYAEHKVEVEDFILESQRDALIFRLDKVVGDSPLEHHLYTEWWKLLMINQPIVCVEGMKISPTAVDDISKAIFLSIQNNYSGLFHLAGPDQLTRYDLANEFCNLAGIPPNVVEKPLKDFGFKDGRALNSCLCAERFCNLTGMRFKNSKEQINAFLKNASK